DQAKYLWSCAAQYRACKRHGKEAEALESYVKLSVKPAKLGEAWYRLGEAYRVNKKGPAAKAAYLECLKFESRYAYLARYHLALAAQARGEIDDAEAALVLNLKLLRWDREPEAQSKSLFALVDLLYQKQHYRRVVRYLEEALTKFKDQPEAMKARYQLADSYRQIAAQENQSFLLGAPMASSSRDHFKSEHKRWLQKAATEFDTLDRLVETKDGKAQLTVGQRSQIPFIAAKCWFNLGDYKKSLKIYDRLIKKESGKVEG